MSSQRGLHTISNLRWWVDLGWLQDIHLAALSLSLLKRMEGECKMKKYYGWDKQGDHFSIPSWVKQNHLVKINLLPIKIHVDRNKDKLAPSPHPSIFPSSTLLLHSWLFYLLPLSGVLGWERGVGGQSIAVHLWPFFLLTLFPCPSAGFLLNGLQSFRKVTWFSVGPPQQQFLQGILTCSTMALSTACTGISLPFPNMLSQRCCDCCWGAQLCRAVGGGTGTPSTWWNKTNMASCL